MNSKVSGIIRLVAWSLAALILTAVLLVNIFDILPDSSKINAAAGKRANSSENKAADTMVSFAKSFDLSTWGSEMNFSGSWGVYKYDYSHKYIIAKDSVNASNIGNININWLHGEVSIYEYDGEDIKFYETSSTAADDELKMHYYIEGENLSIQYCASGTENNKLNNLTKELIIQVPHEYNIADINVKTLSSVDVEEISAGKINMNLVSGNADFFRVKADTIYVNTVGGKVISSETKVSSFCTNSVGGKIDIEGNFDSVKCDSVSGKIMVSSGAEVKKINASSVSGEVVVYLPENIGGFKSENESVSGGVESDFPVIYNKKSMTYGDGSADFNLSTVSGSIKILKY